MIFTYPSKLFVLPLKYSKKGKKPFSKPNKINSNSSFFIKASFANV